VYSIINYTNNLDMNLLYNSPLLYPIDLNKYINLNSSSFNLSPSLPHIALSSRVQWINIYGIQKNMHENNETSNEAQFI